MNWVQIKNEDKYIKCVCGITYNPELMVKCPICESIETQKYLEPIRARAKELARLSYLKSKSRKLNENN